MGQTLCPVFPNMWNINSSDTFPVPITNCVCLDFSMSASLKHFQLPSHGFFVSLVGKNVIKLWPLAGGWSEGQSVTGQDKTESSLAKGGSDWIPGKKKKNFFTESCQALEQAAQGSAQTMSDDAPWGQGLVVNILLLLGCQLDSVIFQVFSSLDGFWLSCFPFSSLMPSV